MRASFALLGLLAGCHKLLGLDPVDVPDAATDAKEFMDGPPPGTLCAGALYFHECALETDLQNLTYPTQSLDTDAANCTKIEQQANGGPDVCVILGLDVSVTGMVRVHGSRPLAIFAMGNFTIDTTAGLDASSDATGDGPNANVGDCDAPAGDMQATNQTAAGGGAGGSLGGQGGDGGAGPTKTARANNPFTPPSLRGGCRGGAGGPGPFGASTAAAGGPSGGAIYLVAGNTLDLKGRVLANGAGGKGAAKTGNTGNMAGGGGGGSGGVIALDAMLITLEGTSLLMASGGGGGGGADGTLNSGTDGGNPAPGTPTMAAAPGNGGATGLDGGRGNNPMMLDPDGGNGKPVTVGTQQGGGGGGGGAAGLIHLLPASTQRNGTQVPTPS